MCNEQEGDKNEALENTKGQTLSIEKVVSCHNLRSTITDISRQFLTGDALPGSHYSHVHSTILTSRLNYYLVEMGNCPECPDLWGPKAAGSLWQ